MTNNDEFKKDASELLSKARAFKKKYPDLARKDSPVDALETELRKLLLVARTDEENNEQRKQDLYC